MRTLTDAETAHFRDEGFVIIPDFFDRREVRALQGEVGALQAAGKLRNVATEGDGTTHSTTAFNLQICPIGLANSRLIASLPWRAGVPDAVGRLLGGVPVQHLDQIFLKPARHGVGTSWHTDNAYFKAADPRHGLGMWTAVHAASRANGTMRFIPRSHLRPWVHVRDGASDHHITCKDLIDDAHAVHVEVPAGGVAFFTYGTAHATGANATAHDRAGLALHFMHADHVARQDHNFHGAEATWRFLSGPRNDGGRAWHGEDLRPVWAQEVARWSSESATADLSSSGTLAGTAV